MHYGSAVDRLQAQSVGSGTVTGAAPLPASADAVLPSHSAQYLPILMTMTSCESNDVLLLAVLPLDLRHEALLQMLSMEYATRSGTWNWN